MNAAELRADPWAGGPWCWVVDRVELFEVPLPCRGMQGLWPVEDQDEDVAQALEDLVPGGARVWSALTLLQPYASAIAYGPKRVENRPWRRRVPAGGLWVGLHAGQLWGNPDLLVPYRVCGRTKAAQVRDQVEETLDEWRAPPLPGEPHWPNAPCVVELPLGVMLGAMHVTEILPFPEDP